jgi:uncharacterized membrane protein
MPLGPLLVAAIAFFIVLLVLTVAIRWRERSSDRGRGRAEWLTRRREAMDRVVKRLASGQTDDPQR